MGLPRKKEMQGLLVLLALLLPPMAVQWVTTSGAMTWHCPVNKRCKACGTAGTFAQTDGSTVGLYNRRNGMPSYRAYET